MSATAIVSVGLAIVQITLLISGDSGHAALAGGMAGLLDRLPVPKPGKEVRAGERVAEEIAERVPSGEEFRRIEDHQWEAAAQDVAALLRDLPKKKRRKAGYDAEALRKAVLKAGGRERRANLGDEEAKTAFDWLLEEACRQVAGLFTDSEALERIIELLGEMSDVLGDIRETQRRGPLVRAVMDDHRDKTQMLAPEKLKDREAEMSDLKAFVQEASEQWVAYVAPMLSGKTAVMATFALRPPRGVRVVSYFVRRDKAGHDRSSFFLATMAQLGEIVGDRFAYSAMPEEQRAILAEALWVATTLCESRGERLVLLIDGLDEDAYFEAADGVASILSVLPLSLPGRLKVITASRPNPPTPTDLECKSWEWRIDRELSSSPHAVAEINPEDVDKFFDDGRGMTVGALLAACEGHLTVDNLSALMNRLGEGERSKALGRFVKRAPGRLLNVMDIGAGRSSIMTYSLGHDVMLRETLRKLDPERFGEGDDPEDELWWAELRDEVLRPYRNTIIDWGKTHEWSRNSPSYLLSESYVSVVQREQGDRGVLELLGVRERNDRIAQRRGNGYEVISLIDEYANRYLEYRSFDCEEYDVIILLSVAEERQRLARSFPYIPGLVTVEALSAEGDFEPLRGLILSFEDPNDRERALKELIDAPLSLEDRRTCIDSGLISDVIDSLRDWPLVCVDALRSEILLFADAGELDRVDAAAQDMLHVSQRIDYPWDRAGVLASVAGGLTRAMRTDEAQAVVCQATEVAEQVEDPEFRDRVLAGVVYELAQVGLVAEAWEVAERIDTNGPHAWALAGVAGGLARTGRIAEARAVIPRAREAAEQTEDSRDRAWALARVADELVRVGLVLEARELAEQVEDPLASMWALARVADELVRVGLVVEARELAEQVEDPRARARVLAGVAGGLARTGQIAEVRAVIRRAREAAEQVEDPRARARVLAGVAGGLARTGQIAEARAVIRRAREAAEQIEDPRDRARALDYVVDELARVEPVVERQDVAEQVEDPRDRALIFGDAADGTAWAAGLFVKALEIAEQIEDPWERAPVLAGISRGLAQAGKSQKALDMAVSLDVCSDHRATALQSALTAMCKQRGIDSALTAARHELATVVEARCVDRKKRASYCGSLSDLCQSCAEAVEGNSEALRAWQSLGRACLAHSWLLGASVWEHFETFMRLAPDLALRLVRERLLTDADSDGITTA